MQLHYQSYGVGPPLIILHGLFGSLANWSTLSQKFGEHYRVFAVDQRNHGNSPHSATFDYPALAEDLHEFMQAHQLPPARLLGHSMGGKTAMQFALTYPDKVDKLIVVDIAPKSYSRHHDEILDALLSLDLNAYGSRLELDRALAQRIPDTAVRQFLLTNATRDETGGFKWKINIDAISRNYDRIIIELDTNRTFTGPTLFIKGEHSDYIQAEDIASIKVMFPRATIVSVAGVGHWVHAEAPERFLRLVLQFLGS